MLLIRSITQKRDDIRQTQASETPQNELLFCNLYTIEFESMGAGNSMILVSPNHNSKFSLTKITNKKTQNIIKSIHSNFIWIPLSYSLQYNSSLCAYSLILHSLFFVINLYQQQLIYKFSSGTLQSISSIQILVGSFSCDLLRFFWEFIIKHH